jgi:hypothetical protein
MYISNLFNKLKININDNKYRGYSYLKTNCIYSIMLLAKYCVLFKIQIQNSNLKTLMIHSKHVTAQYSHVILHYN